MRAQPRNWTLSLVAATAAALAGCTGPATTGGPGTGPGPGGTDSLAEPATVGHFEAPGKSLAYPVRVAGLANGDVYVTDVENNQVVGYKSNQAAVAIVGLDQPLGLAVSGDLLFVGNRGRKDVEVYSLGQRKFVRSLGGAGAFQMPTAIAVGPDGLVYIVDARADLVRVFTSDGAAAGTFGSRGTGNGQFMFPIGVAVDDKRVVIADQGNHRIQIFDRSGAFVRSFGGEVTRGRSRTDYRGRFTGIGSVALASDLIYVLDSAHSYVQVLDEFGASKGFMGQAGSCATCMKLGLDVTVDEAGRVLATDPDNRRWVSLSTELR